MGDYSKLWKPVLLSVFFMVAGLVFISIHNQKLLVDIIERFFVKNYDIYVQICIIRVLPFELCSI